MSIVPNGAEINFYISDKLSGQAHIDDFLAQFRQHPAVILFKGQNPKRRCRIIVTLLHGNEPSGVYALQRLISNRTEPIADTYVIVASVRAATTAPNFYFRMLPGQRDLNRCFSDPAIIDAQSRLALRIKAFIRTKQPELVMDLHNTSGESPAFAVSHVQNREHATLCQLFSPYIVYSTIKVGALFEQNFGCPNVTIECGGAGSEISHEIAYSGLHRLFRAEIAELVLESEPPTWLNSPIRLELKPGTRLVYADKVCAEADLTLPRDIDRHNFGIWESDRPLGWLGDKGMEIFVATSPHGHDCLSHLFFAHEKQLYPAVPLHLFMITNRADIALSDCLLYAVPS